MTADEDTLLVAARVFGAKLQFLDLKFRFLLSFYLLVHYCKIHPRENWTTRILNPAEIEGTSRSWLIWYPCIKTPSV